MFRNVVRTKQILPEEECIQLLKDTKRGVMSVLGDDDYPYGMPLNHWYDEKTGWLYFHSGNSGHKVDAIRRHPKVSYCVIDEGTKLEDDWALRFKSVIVFGRLRVVEDRERALEITRRLSHKFTADEDYINEEIQRSGPGVLVFELVPEHMTGKLVNEK